LVENVGAGIQFSLHGGRKTKVEREKRIKDDDDVIQRAWSDRFSYNNQPQLSW
jgi:hypothetical protein